MKKKNPNRASPDFKKKFTKSFNPQNKNFSKKFSPSYNRNEIPDLNQEILRQFSPEFLKNLVQQTKTEIEKMLRVEEPVPPILSQSFIQEENSDALELIAKGKSDRGFKSKSFGSKKESEKTLPLSSSLSSKPSPAPSLPTFKNHLDPWQEQAVAAIMAGHHLIVDAPTSAGKTRVIECFIDAKINNGLKLIYTSPVKSLSNDKYVEFSEKYGKDNVGINTGDFKENLGAPIILATLETYRNSLLGVEPPMHRMLVVYDEYHYLQDESRGSAWEESIILTPPHSQIVMLSASVPNASDFADWIENLTQKSCKVISVTTRPVPLVDLVYTQYGFILGSLLQLNKNQIATFRRMEYDFRLVARRLPKKDKEVLLVNPVEETLQSNLYPLVVYASRRGDVENAAFILGRNLKAPYNPSEKEALQKRIESLSGFEYLPSELQRLIKRQGIAYHHSGLIQPGRLAIETLLKEGLLRICCGTMGISLGVNFAVRSAFVTDYSRPGNNGEIGYTATEVMQMLGRAGRRGKDKQGFSVWGNMARFVSQKPSGREKCESSLKFDPVTVLSILGQHKNLALLSNFYKKSFFLRKQGELASLVAEHDLLTAYLYSKHSVENVPCSDIPVEFEKFLSKKNQKALCHRCSYQNPCHTLMQNVTNTRLHVVIKHLKQIKAIEEHNLTLFGEIARFFPQAGGMLISNWISQGSVTTENIYTYLQAIACFCAAQHKDIPTIFASMSKIKELKLEQGLEYYYPQKLFPELYDDAKYSSDGSKLIFREFNYGGASIVNHWLKPECTWKNLIECHTTKNFSEGDCMMVLFRFATFLQSLARLEQFPELAEKALEIRAFVLRDPLDVRNKMLLEEVEEPLEEETNEDEEETNEDEEETEEEGSDENAV